LFFYLFLRKASLYLNGLHMNKHIKLSIVLLLLLLPAMSFAQTKADYEHAAARFKKFYNAGQADSIANMWPESDRKNTMWSAPLIADLHKQYGIMISYSWLGKDPEDPNDIAVFKTEFTKAMHKTTSFSLDKNNKLGTFRFITRSSSIDKMLADENTGKKNK